MKLVTAIMPTKGRHKWAAEAVDLFHQQDYPFKQLVILDDADDPSFLEPVWHSQIEYSRFKSDNIGVKRNVCCHMATGEIIIHWDSDDWYAKNRIRDQVDRLESSGKSVTGYHSMLFYEEANDRWGKYTSMSSYAVGVSLCYYKSWWEANKFVEQKRFGEDNAFVNSAASQHQLLSVDGHLMIVARVHAGNTSPKYIDRFIPVHRPEIQGFVK